MDPHTFLARAEAQRWIAIADKLLKDHDLLGAKTFAVRARDSDPTLEAADQILAIADTLLAAEKRVVGKNGTHQPDFYAILHVVQFLQDTDHISEQYRRLSVLLNPNQNRFPYSDQAFQLVNDAWAVLSDPMRKSTYDSELDFQMNPIGFKLEVEEQHHQKQHQRNFLSINRLGSDHDRKSPEPEQTFEARAQMNHQQHNFLSQNPVRYVPPQSPQPNPPVQPPPPPPPAAPPQPPLSRPQAPPLSPPQQKQQEEESLEQNTDDDSPTFWTTCPYCLYMYEYPRVYADCTLRCDNCKRAFQAVRIPSPPLIIKGQEAHFYCWGSFPFGVSMSHLQKNNGTASNSNWTPFSTMYEASSNVQDHLNCRAAPKKNFSVNKSSGPRIYKDDVTDDIFTGISESEGSDGSDLEWRGTKEKKVKRVKKSLKSGSKKDTQVLSVRVRTARNGRDKKTQDHIPTTTPVAEGSKKDLGGNTKGQSGRVAKELGKLDLNVKFNDNEGEEGAPRMSGGNRGNGEEDNIEGTGFFEGLDEFLSSLPILSVVNEEKVKAA